MLISVVVPTYNRADTLRKTLLHLSEQKFGEDWEVIVVNNNSTDHTESVAREFTDNFPVPLRYFHESKPGASAARNRGARESVGRFVLFIDNDIFLPPDALSRMWCNAGRDEEAWFVGFAENLPEQRSSAFGKFRHSLEAPAGDSLRETDMITGQITWMPRKHFDQLGGFDENFHVASGEDRELAIRALQAGIRIYFDPTIRVLHDDWAGASVKDYCERQRTYTLTEPFFWKKYGQKTPRLKMVKENIPPSLKRDGLRLYSWKKFKGLLGSPIGQKVLFRLCRATERFFPRPVILWKLYRLAIAGAIYRGFNEGLAFFNVDTHSLAKDLEKKTIRCIRR